MTTERGAATGRGWEHGAADPAPFTYVGAPEVPLVATAIHAGHDLRAELRSRLRLDDDGRRREEDPHTDRLIGWADTRVVAHRSRFEVDLNRDRHEAVYRTPDDCWGLEVWDDALPEDVVERSLALHDAFYERLAALLDPLADRGPFVVFDVHSYNHRRHGPDQPPARAIENPDVNVGTGSLDRRRWAPVVDALMRTMDGTEVAGRPLDVRENVRFRGGAMSRWVHRRYPGRGCALALEFKKTFMDEWTGTVDEDHLDGLTAALRSTVPSVLDALGTIRPVAVA